MTSIEEQARAEAEKRYPGVATWVAEARDMWADGFLAGHEAATRTRVVTTDQVAAIIGDALRDWTQGCNRRAHCDGDGQMGIAYTTAWRVMALYDPEEGR